MRPSVPVVLIAFVLVALGFGAAPAFAEEPSPDISIEDLRLEIKPLRRAELEGVAEAWIDAVKSKVAEVGRVLVRVRDAKEGEDTEQLSAELTEYGQQRKALVERTEVVLGALERKGGDATEYRQYLEAISDTKELVDAAGLGPVLLAWLKSPEGGLKWGRSLLAFFAILFVFRIVSNIVGRFVKRALKTMGNTPELLRNFLGNIVRNVLFFIGLVIALSQLGVDIGPLLAAIGGAGFVIGFALQSTLSNFASGVMILLYQPYELGDVVSFTGAGGTVEAMTLVSTTVKTPDNQLVVVPNSKIWGDVITNVTGSDTRRVDLVFGIGYEDDMSEAQQILEDVVAAHPEVLEAPSPVVKVSELADSSVNYIVRPWCKTESYWDVYWDLTRTVKEQFDAAGISIPYPQSDVHVHQVPAG